MPPISLGSMSPVSSPLLFGKDKGKSSAGHKSKTTVPTMTGNHKKKYRNGSVVAFPSGNFRRSGENWVKTKASPSKLNHFA